MNRNSLLKQHNMLLEYLRAYIATNGYPPSRAEMAAAMDRSVATISDQLITLEHFGWIMRRNGWLYVWGVKKESAA